MCVPSGDRTRRSGVGSGEKCPQCPAFCSISAVGTTRSLPGQAQPRRQIDHVDDRVCRGVDDPDVVASTIRHPQVRVVLGQRRPVSVRSFDIFTEHHVRQRSVDAVDLRVQARSQRERV